MSTSKDTLLVQLLATLKAAMRSGNSQQIQQAIKAFEARADEVHGATQSSRSQSDGKTSDPSAKTSDESRQTSR